MEYGRGGAADLEALIETDADKMLSDYARDVGFGAVTREDDAYLVGEKVCQRVGVLADQFLPLVEGDSVRDWSIDNPVCAIWPYHAKSLTAQADITVSRYLWPLKRRLSLRVAHGLNQLERGLRW